MNITKDFLLIPQLVYALHPAILFMQATDDRLQDRAPHYTTAVPYCRGVIVEV